MNNSSAIGYMILAAKALKLDKELTRKLEREMLAQMDLHTIEEAADAYVEFR